MRSISIALILTFPLTCFAGSWSEVIASTIISIEKANDYSYCQNGVCFIRQRQKAVVVTSNPTTTVKRTSRIVYRQRTYTRPRIFQNRRLFRGRTLFRGRRCGC